MLENDSYAGHKWDAFYADYMHSRNRRVFRYYNLLRGWGVPARILRFLNERLGSPFGEHQTVVCDLKSFKPNKKVRYALKRFPVDEVKRTKDYAEATRFVQTYRKKLGLFSGPEDNIKKLNEYGCAVTYAAYKQGQIVGCLSIAPGKKWITELIAAGLQDAIKVKVIEDFKGTHDYYDLAGYDGSERARFKKKYGKVERVRFIY